MATFTATVTCMSTNGDIYLDVHRGNFTDQLDEYFGFEAHFTSDGNIEFFFGDESECIFDPIEHKRQYDLLQSFHDNKALVENLKDSLVKLLNSKKCGFDCSFEFEG